jgi:pimeloyl-ACP methyl ester carboxylesterase
VRFSNAFLPAVGALLAAFCVLSDASVASAAKSAKPPKPAKSAKPAAPAKRPGGLTFEPYQIKMIDGTMRDAELGRFYVPESRDRDTTHLIRLAFLRWKSTSPKPGAPIVYLAGGPGIPGSTLARVPAYARLFEKLRALGDVIVPDQRGTGLSEPSLACAPSPPDPTMFESETAMRQAILKQVQRCVAPFRADGIAIEAFDTHESANDVEDIRRALGADRLRLVASSYGCELALETIRLFGSRVQRAALSGVRSPDKALKLPGVLDLQLRRISGLVAKDSSYASNPTVEVLTRALIGELDKRPISLSTAPVSGGAQEPMKIAGAGLAAVLQGDLTDPRAVIAVPAMLNAMAAGDFRFFLSRLQILFNTMATGASIMSVSANCASGANPERITQVEREAAGSPFGNVRNLYMDPVLCGAIGAHDLGPRYRARIYSLVPTLFLSGSLDATTPSFEAEEVSWGFPNGVHIVVDNGFHDTLPEEDVQRPRSSYRWTRPESCSKSRLSGPADFLP